MVEQLGYPLEYSRFVFFGGRTAKAGIRDNGLFEPGLHLVVAHCSVKVWQKASGNQLLESTECRLEADSLDLVDRVQEPAFSVSTVRWVETGSIATESCRLVDVRAESLLRQYRGADHSRNNRQKRISVSRPPRQNIQLHNQHRHSIAHSMISFETSDHVP